MEHARSQISLIVGLGNPGLEYAFTRHNMGFMTVGRLLNKLNNGFESYSRYNSEIFSGRYRGRRLLLQLPQTYMNCSGEAVRRLMAVEELLPENLLVVYDDLDIPFGRLRLRAGGSSGGHRGMESIISELGSESFIRLRVGIGHPGKGGVSDYVLSGFAEEEREKLEKVTDTAAEAVKSVLLRGLSAAMNQYNKWNFDEEMKKEQAQDVEFKKSGSAAKNS